MAVNLYRMARDNIFDVAVPRKVTPKTAITDDKPNMLLGSTLQVNQKVATP